MQFPKLPSLMFLSVVACNDAAPPPEAADTEASTSEPPTADLPPASPDVPEDPTTSGGEELEGPEFAGQLEVAAWSWPRAEFELAYATAADEPDLLCFYGDGPEHVGEVIVPPGEVVFVDVPASGGEEVWAHRVNGSECPATEPDTGPRALVYEGEGFVYRVDSEITVIPEPELEWRGLVFNLSSTPLTICSASAESPNGYIATTLSRGDYSDSKYLYSEEDAGTWIIPGRNDENCLTHNRWLESEFEAFEGTLAGDLAGFLVLQDGDGA